jgi:hypothetical protein
MRPGHPCPICGGSTYYMDGKTSRQLKLEEERANREEREGSEEEDEG